MVVLAQNSRLQSVTAKKSQQELLEKTVGMTAATRSVRMRAPLSSLSSLLSGQDPNLGNSEKALPAFGLGLPISVKGIKTTPQTSPRPKLSRHLLTESLFWCDSNCVKLTNKPSHHDINIFIVYPPVHRLRFFWILNIMNNGKINLDTDKFVRFLRKFI